MKYHIDEANNKFAYLQLYEQLRKDIVQKVLLYGNKLPSKRLLAEETGTSVITVEHAYSILCEEGYIESRERSGYYVIYSESEFLSTSGTMNRTQLVHKRCSNVKHDFPFSVLSKTMRKVLAEYGENILVKSPNRGCPELQAAIASYLARSNGIVVDVQQVVIGSGAEYLYSLIVQLLGKNKIFALENPSYEKIEQVYRANGVSLDMLEMGYDGIKTAELEKTDATVLHITPFHSFPSGITASVSKRQEYLRWAEKRKGYIIEENYDSELTVLTKNDDTVFSLAHNDLVIYLNTFSETIAPSMRIGYMILPAQLMEVFRQRLGFYSCTVPVFEQYVLAELINNGDFERHVNRVRRARRKAK